jgi:hypothetical protein
LFLAYLLHGAIALGGVPSVSQVEVTDVTPGSFAVTWTASEPATGTLVVLASDCSTTVTVLSLVSEGSDTTSCLKVTAAGLAADTAYCYQTSTMSRSTSDTSVYPAQPATVATTKAVLRTMATGTVITPFANDLLKVPAVYLRTVADVPDGMLEVLYLDGGHGPLSLLLTSDSKTRYFNMNNLFSAATGSSLNLTGNERVRISERHGASGCVIDRWRRVPADQELTAARDFITSPKPQDIDFDGTVNILDVLRVAGGMGSSKGDACFNSELDVMRHNRVDQQDLSSVIGSFDAKP